jgi:hypothetical protein
MNGKLFIATCLAAACLAGAARAEQEVVQFNGDESTVTAPFEVEAPWIIDWRVTSEYRAGPSIEVWLIDADSEANLGYVLSTTGTGDGVKLFEDGGYFYLRVNSSLMDWHLAVTELTAEEAAAYTPKE